MKRTESICRSCFHSYVCDEFNAYRDSDNKRCHYFYDHFVPYDDVAKVVRCRDCKSYCPESITMAKHCVLTGVSVEPDDFCSYGERKAT